ncbi:MAG: sodium:solute symporter, partial [Planctomycetota bacterium]|nr:sodium:solute symporter [Planctomycetota bacterium]
MKGYLDYSIVFGFLAGLIVVVCVSNRYTKSVSDFLVSGRSAGRYILTISRGMLWLDAVNIIAMFELYMEAGLTAMWWEVLFLLSGVYVAITGFGAYRFRQTRVLTLAQFFEVRYSKSVRIVSGIFSWVSGVLCFGLFPAVGARFFIYFCQLPTSFHIMGLTLSTFPILMIGLILLSLFFVCVGGHIAILITDFLQGSFTHIASVVIMLVLFFTVFDWDKISEVLKLAPVGMSQVNPNDTSKIGDFNVWYFAVAIFARWYNVMSFSAEQTYISSAKTAHEFKISATLHFWRWLALCVFFMVLVLISKMYLFHPSFAQNASSINSVLDSVSTNLDDPIRKQLTVTVALTQILPIGLKGLFCTIMLAALISTYDSFMHTFGAVFLQDVVMPFRKKPFSNKEHIFWLRVSAAGVALFALLFS